MDTRQGPPPVRAGFGGDQSWALWGDDLAVSGLCSKQPGGYGTAGTDATRDRFFEHAGPSTRPGQRRVSARNPFENGGKEIDPALMTLSKDGRSAKVRDARQELWEDDIAKIYRSVEFFAVRANFLFERRASSVTRSPDR